MPFKDYVDACKQLADWCYAEANACSEPREKVLWLDAAAHWLERALIAEAELLSDGDAREDPEPSSGDG